jgi:hypothetical protein
MKAKKGLKMKKIIFGCMITAIMLSGCWWRPYYGDHDGGRHGGHGMEMHEGGEGRDRDMHGGEDGRR